MTKTKKKINNNPNPSPIGKIWLSKKMFNRFRFKNKQEQRTLEFNESIFGMVKKG